MITDISTVMLKELKEWLFQRGNSGRGNFRGGWVGQLVFIGIFGIFLPFQIGPDWVNNPMALAYWSWVPLFMVSGVTADAFAGERERHTLETLLASRLSDRAILFGKIAAAVAYGWGLTIASLILGVLTVNVAFWPGHVLMYAPWLAGSGLALSLLAAGLSATAGVLISLRASSVRQAVQTMGIAIMVVLFVPIFGLRALPAETQARLMQTLGGANLSQIVWGAAAVLLTADAVLLLAAMARFRRARLILD